MMCEWRDTIRPKTPYSGRVGTRRMQQRNVSILLGERPAPQRVRTMIDEVWR